MELYSLMLKAVLCLDPTPCNVFVYPKRIWPEVLYAFSFRCFVSAPSVQTINFTFSELPCLWKIGDLRSA